MKQCEIYIVKQGQYFSEGYIDCIFRLKKDAIKYCRRNGFKYHRQDDLFYGYLYNKQYWRSIEPIEFYDSYNQGD